MHALIQSETKISFLLTGERHTSVLFHRWFITCREVIVLWKKQTICAHCSTVEMVCSMPLSYCSVPENCLLFGIRRRAIFLGPSVLLPTWQNRHAILFAKSFLWLLSSLYFFAQATLFLNHIQHCMVSLQPLHTCHLSNKNAYT